MAVSRINEAGLNVNQYGNRNIIINGAMQVAQRGTSSTGIGAAATTYYTVDRWLIETGNSAGRFTMSQASDGPSGFANSLKLDCTTADTSIASSEYLLLQYRIEGQDVQRIKKGTSDAEEVTISFYVKANAAFDFVLELYDNDNNRTCSKLFSTTTGWNRIELTYPADTTGAFDDDNNASVRLFFWLHAGSDYTSGTLNSSAFNTQNNANRAPGISSFYSSTSNEFYITGVQMEVGDTATDFEHRTFADEMQRCRRYTFVHETGVAYAWSALSGYSNTTSNALTFYQFPVEMRASPSIAVYGDWQLADGHSVYTVTSMSAGTMSPITARVDVGASGLTIGRIAAIRNNNDSDARIVFDAEL